MVRKKTRKEVVAQLAGFGFEFLDEEYVSGKHKHLVRCPKGHEFLVSIVSLIKTKGGCLECYNLRRGKTQVLDSSEVRKRFEAAGYYFLDQEYVNNNTPMLFKCKAGHVSRMTLSNLSRGKRCGQCSPKRPYEGDKLESIRERMNAEGYTLNEVIRGEGKTKISVTCPNGHRRSIYPSVWNRGARCLECHQPEITHEDASNYFKLHGYELLTPYKNAKLHLETRCPNGHKYKVTFYKFKNQGTRCPECGEGHGKFDRTITAILYYLKFEPKNKLPFYKIGVTNKTIKQRFRHEPVPYKVLMEKTFLFGYLAQQEESEILKKFERYKHLSPDLKWGGHTECFTKDVLKLDLTVQRKSL